MTFSNSSSIDNVDNIVLETLISNIGQLSQADAALQLIKVPRQNLIPWRAYIPGTIVVPRRQAPLPIASLGSLPVGLLQSGVNVELTNPLSLRRGGFLSPSISNLSPAPSNNYTQEPNCILSSLPMQVNVQDTLNKILSHAKRRKLS